MPRSPNKIDATLGGSDSWKTLWEAGRLTEPKRPTKIKFAALPQWGPGGYGKNTDPGNGHGKQNL